MKWGIILIQIFFLMTQQLYAQTPDHMGDSLQALSKVPFHKTAEELEKIERSLDKKTRSIIERLQKQEKQLKRKLNTIDSISAKNLFTESLLKYESLENEFSDPSKLIQLTAGNYFPKLDSLKTAVKYLDQFKNMTGLLNLPAVDLKSLLSSAEGLDNKVRKAEIINQFIHQRQKILQEKLTALHLTKYLIKYQKEVFFFNQQVNEYRNVIKDPDKIISVSIRLLTKNNAIRDFISKNSDLARLFPIPAFSNAPAVNGAFPQLQGLQTRVQTQNSIQGIMGQNSENSQQILQQSLLSARAQLDKLKSKIDQLGGDNMDLESPQSFKPNYQKTKSIWSRIELGTNVQNTRSNGFFPTTTDFGISAGYKLNESSIFGIGASFKLGWGKDIKHIVVTSQGAGLRSFLDWKIKESIYISGGAEFNYFKSIAVINSLKNYDNWQRSMLLGVKKKYKVGGKLKAEIALLYDFMWQENKPVRQPIYFRFGYTLK